MNEGIARYRSRFFSKPVTARKQPVPQDYKARLWSTRSNGREAIDQVVDCQYALRVRSLVSSLHGSVACQSVAVAVLQTLDRVLRTERQAASAAISLAQGEKLERMIETSEETLMAIADALNAQGSQMMSLSLDDDPQIDTEKSWWFALTEAIESVENGTRRVLSLASGQPKGGAVRQLGTIVVQLLRNKHRQLLSEAEAWIA